MEIRIAKRRRNKPAGLGIALLLCVMVLLLVAYAAGVFPGRIEWPTSGPFASSAAKGESTADVQATPHATTGKPQLSATRPIAAQGDLQDLTVHFLDVGKADAILVQCGGQNMLIDGGRGETQAYLLSYLEEAVEQIDVVVATHPHEDHIGGLPAVIERYAPARAYLSPAEHTTRAFESLLLNLGEYVGETRVPKAGEQFSLGSATCTVLAPLHTYAGLNDMSLVIRIDHGDNSLLLMADAERPSERDLLSEGAHLSATLLKLGHHGSSTSTGRDFLEAVSPQYVVITCGVEEDGPHAEVLQRMEPSGIPVYTTAYGPVLCTSDGKTLHFSAPVPSE